MHCPFANSSATPPALVSTRVRFLTKPLPNSSSERIPNAQKSNSTCLQPCILASMRKTLVFQLAAPAGCSKAKYLPARTCFMQRCTANERWRIPSATLSLTFPTSIRSKFQPRFNEQNGLQIGPTMTRSGLSRSRSSTALSRLAGLLKSQAPRHRGPLYSNPTPIWDQLRTRLTLA